jgi:hypothetical protein
MTQIENEIANIILRMDIEEVMAVGVEMEGVDKTKQ